VFETFPLPESTARLEAAGKALDGIRREIMLRRSLGLTKLYNLINDPEVSDISDEDVARLRRIHVDIDQAVIDAFGWPVSNLDYGFHTYRRVRRWMVGSSARVELLDRLLEENHKRAAAQGDMAAPSEDDHDGEDE
jgi:hypothetical protein